MAKGTPGTRRLGGAEEAYRAGFENPLAGDIGPLQRLYGTVQAMREELGGADMGTPFGQRFGERQAATREEVRRLQALRAAHPEEFGRGQMMAQDQMDPYMLDLGIGTARAMRPGVTAFSPPEGPMEPGYGGELTFRPRGRMPSPPGEAIEMGAPYWPNAVPRGMNRFKANTFGMTYGRPGNEMYRYSNMDFVPAVGEGRGMAERAGAGAGAVAPYREGGLVYEPVEGMAQGREMVSREIPGEFRDVFGIEGPSGAPGTSPMGFMDFGVTRDGMEMAGQPRRGLGAGAGLGAMAMMAAAPGYLADTGMGASMAQAPADRTVQLPPIDVFGRQGASALSGQAPGAGSAFEGPRAQGRAPSRAPGRVLPKGRSMGRGSKGKGVPMPPRREGEGGAAPAGAFEPNLNYLITAAIDRMLGQREAERGREFQQYYERNPL